MITFHISALIGRENLENGVSADLGEMTNKLQVYLDKGRVASASEAREEPLTRIRPDSSMIKPLSKMKESNSNFLAVDCATRTLKRANNWGIYLMRAAYAAIKGRDVNWNYLERLCTTVGDAYTRSNVLTDVRIELESQMALELLTKGTICFTTRVPFLVVIICCLTVGDISVGRESFGCRYMRSARRIVSTCWRYARIPHRCMMKEEEILLLPRVCSLRMILGSAIQCGRLTKIRVCTGTFRSSNYAARANGSSDVT